jgi:hypothetical protein
MKENSIRQSSRTYKPYNRNFEEQKTPGKIVGVIAVTAIEVKRNPHVVFLTVNKHRKDYKKVMSQVHHQKIAKLPEYEDSLFTSCFKNWS